MRYLSGWWHQYGSAIKALNKQVATSVKQPKQSGSASKIAFEKLSKEMQAEAKACADQVISIMPDVVQALETLNMFCESYPDDDDLKPGLWSLLDSKTRSAIKAHQASLKGS